MPAPRAHTCQVPVHMCPMRITCGLANSSSSSWHNLRTCAAGKRRRWDAVQAHDSVAVSLYHEGLQAFILVRQFRPAVYAARWRHATAAGLPQPPAAAGVQSTHRVQRPSSACSPLTVCSSAQSAVASPVAVRSLLEAHWHSRRAQRLPLAATSWLACCCAWCVSAGLCYELCAGIMDKAGKTPAQVRSTERAVYHSCASPLCWSARLRFNLVATDFAQCRHGVDCWLGAASC
jgi:hypothetical protein